MTLTQIKPAGLSKPVDLADNEQIRLGTGNDLLIFHDGTNSSVQNGTGTLRLRGDSIKLNNNAASENYLVASANGAVELYYDNSKKAETDSFGFEVLGELRVTGGSYGNTHFNYLGNGNNYINQGNSSTTQFRNASATVRTQIEASGNWTWKDNIKVQVGDSQDLKIYHDGTDSIITNSTGKLTLSNASSDSSVYLQYGSNNRLYTDMSGVGIIGNLAVDSISTTDHVTIPDSKILKLGTGSDLQIYHDGTDSIISHQGATGGDLIIQTTGSDDDVFIKCNDDFIVNVQNGNENAIIARNSGTVELYYDAAKKFETLSDGVDINGASFDTHLKILGNKFLSRSRCGYSTSYSGVTLGRTDATFNSTIFMGVDTSANASGAFTGDGREVVFRNNHSFVIPNAANNGYLTPIALNKGAATEGVPRFKQGVLFGTDTANANILDDYEEGTFTPVFANGLVASSYESNGQKGVYTKIGRYVYGTILLHLAAASTQNSNVIDINGLPFTAGNNSTIGGQSGGAQYFYQDGFYNSNGFTGIVISNGTQIRLYRADTGAYLTGTSVNGGREIRVDFSYHAA